MSLSFRSTGVQQPLQGGLSPALQLRGNPEHFRVAMPDLQLSRPCPFRARSTVYHLHSLFSDSESILDIIHSTSQTGHGRYGASMRPAGGRGENTRAIEPGGPLLYQPPPRPTPQTDAAGGQGPTCNESSMGRTATPYCHRDHIRPSIHWGAIAGPSPGVRYKVRIAHRQLEAPRGCLRLRKSSVEQRRRRCIMLP